MAVRTALSRLDASPACEEWASSAMIAKFLPFRSAWVRISSRAKGKVWMVTMMIFVPPCSASASSCDFGPAQPGDVGDNPWGAVDLTDRLLQLSVQDVAVGDHDDRVEHRLVGLVVQRRQPVRHPGDLLVLPDPAECWIRYRCPGPSLGRPRPELGDRLPLVEAREQHRLGADLLVRHRIDFVGDLQVQERPRMSSQVSRCRICSHRYAVGEPCGLGGFPA